MLSNLENFVFFDTTSTESDSKVLGNANRGQMLSIQVSDAPVSGVNIVIKGKVDYNATSFENLTVFNAGDKYRPANSITSNGLYIVDVTGISQCKAVCSQGLGTVKVFGILIG